MDEILPRCSDNNIKIDSASVMKCSSMVEYDSLVTCKLFGFKTVDDYYSYSSCLNFIHGKERIYHNTHPPGISVPVFFISAVDDPIFPPENIPRELCSNRKNTLLIVTERF